MARSALGRFVAVPLEERIWDKVDAAGDCWEWTGALVRGGYGFVQVRKPKSELAHRAVWRILVGPIPEGFELDHLCQNTRCVNPDHLEVVTHAENLRRAKGQLTTRNKAKTACRNGHAFTPENTYQRTDRPGRRECRACQTKRNNEAALKRRQKVSNSWR